MTTINVSGIDSNPGSATYGQNIQAQAGDYLNIGGLVTSDIVSHTFDTPFQISTTQIAAARYTVEIVNGITDTGTIYLEISPNNSNWVEVTRFVNNMPSADMTAQLSTTVPTGYYVRLRTSVTGSPILTYITGQEALI